MAESDFSSTNTTAARSTATGESDGNVGGSSRARQGDYESAPQTANTGFVNRIKESAAAELTSQRDRGIDALGSVAQAVRSTTNTLREEKHDTIAGYAEQAAGQIERWSQRLREKDIDELIGDMHRLARRQPAVFIGSAFGIGLLAARFLKSSRPQNIYVGRSETPRSQYRGDSRVVTVHDAPVAHAVGASARGDLADSVVADTTAGGAETASSTDSGRGTRTGGVRKSPARTERR
jgi:hypothetical protein